MLLSKVDFSYVGAIKNNMFRFGIGMNKLFDAMMGGKPILYAVEAPNNYIVQYDCGVSVKAEDIEDLTLGLKKLLNCSDEQLETMGENGRNAVVNNFTYDILANCFIKIINKTLM